MRVDIPGRVQNLKLPASKGLMPVFEAIVNSIHAIQEREPKQGTIRIEVLRNPSLLTETDHGNTTAPITGFRIVDDGVGFTTANFDSFETLDSRAKAAIGGKGVGRLLWLKAFSDATIDSHYEEGGKWFRRKFSFRPTKDGIENAELTAIDKGPRQTVIELRGFMDRYRAAAPKSGEALAARVIEHCLEFLVLNQKIAFQVVDDSYTWNLHEIFERDYQVARQTRTFNLAGQTFELMDLFVRNAVGGEHQLHFCAHSRSVKEMPLRERLNELPKTFTLEGHIVTYAGYLRSTFLDEHVDAERTDFQLDRRGELSLVGEPTWEDLVDAVTDAVEENLKDHLKQARAGNVARVRDFAASKEPRYRYLIEHRREKVERLAPHLTDNQLDVELHKIQNDWRSDVKKKALESLEQTKELSDSAFEQFRKEFVTTMGELEEVGKADLAEYVLLRRTVLGFFERLLAPNDAGKFANENALHSLIFPMRKTSDQVEYNDHNLWLIDERLAFHDYLASDLRLKMQNGPVASASDSRPDLIIYNRRFAFAPGPDPFPSVVIVEFKKPERDDYDEDDNPISQVLGYVEEIRAGKARRRDNSVIEPVPPSTPIYCYIISTLTPRLRQFAKLLDFTATHDSRGYFSFRKEYGAYVEVLSPRKVVTDATNRNKAFFDKLGLG